MEKVKTMAYLCNELSKATGKKVNYIGKDEPTLEQFPSLVVPIQVAVSSGRYEEKDFPLIVGALDEKNPNKDKYVSYTLDGDDVVKLGYGFQRFLLGMNREGYFIQKIPLHHGVTNTYGDPGLSFIKIMNGGFNAVDPTTREELTTIKEIRDWFRQTFSEDERRNLVDVLNEPNTYLAYPKRSLWFLQFSYQTELDGIKKGDRYRLIFFETEEPPYKRHKEAKPWFEDECSLQFVECSFPEDMIGIIYLRQTDAKTRNKKIEAYVQELYGRNLVFMQNKRVIEKSLGNLLPQYRDIARYIGFERD
jgi:hypothetical protein